MVHVNFGNPVARREYLSWRQRHSAVLHRLKIAGIADNRRRSIMLERATGGTRRMSVVLDIDEVLLCNIRAAPTEGTLSYNPRRWVEKTFADVSVSAGVANRAAAAIGEAHPGSWPPDEAWAHLTRDGTGFNPPMPGALGVLEKCRELGLDIFLVTGRAECLRADTVDNLELAGMTGDHTGLRRQDLMVAPGGGKQVLMMAPEDMTEYGTAGAFKLEMRKRLESSGHRISTNVGDQLSDLGEHGDEQVLIPHSFYHTK
jgi:hypothetical protein